MCLRNCLISKLCTEMWVLLCWNINLLACCSTIHPLVTPHHTPASVAGHSVMKGSINCEHFVDCTHFVEHRPIKFARKCACTYNTVCSCAFFFIFSLVVSLMLPEKGQFHSAQRAKKPQGNQSKHFTHSKSTTFNRYNATQAFSSLLWTVNTYHGQNCSRFQKEFCKIFSIHACRFDVILRTF